MSCSNTELLPQLASCMDPPNRWLVIANVNGKAVVWPKREAVNGLRVQRKKTLAAHQMKSRPFWADADMLPLERVMGTPEAIMSDQSGIGVGLELKCPHCGGHLKLISEDQPWMYLSRLKRKLGHVLVVTVIYESGGSMLYLATTREPETKI